MSRCHEARERVPSIRNFREPYGARRAPDSPSPSHRSSKRGRQQRAGGARRVAHRGRHADPPADTGKRGGQQYHGDHRRGYSTQAGADIARCAERCAGAQRRPDRRAGRNHLGLHSRRKFEPDQGLYRRHRRDRSGHRHVQFRAHSDLGHRARRSGARPAKRALRRRCDRRRHQHHYEEGVGAGVNSPAAWRAARLARSTKMPG